MVVSLNSRLESNNEEEEEEAKQMAPTPNGSNENQAPGETHHS